MIATAASALSDELFGFEAKWALDDPLRRARARARAARARSASCAASSRTVAVWVVPARDRVPDLVGARRRRRSARSGTGPARAASPSGRAPTSSSASPSPGSRSRADYTRFSRDAARSAFWGDGHRLPVPDALAARARRRALLLARPRRRRCAAGRRRRRGLVAFVALLALTVAETDEAFANAYSGAVSLQNLVPARAAARARRRDDRARDDRRADDRPRLLPVVPAPARLVLRAAVRGAARRLAASPGAPTARSTSSPRPAWRAGPIAAWVAGFALYQWLSPTGPSLVGRPRRPARSAGVGHRRDGAELRRLVRRRGLSWLVATARRRPRTLTAREVTRIGCPRAAARRRRKPRPSTASTAARRGPAGARSSRRSRFACSAATRPDRATRCAEDDRRALSTRRSRRSACP